MEKKFFKRVLPTLLAIAMMLTSVPANVLAEDFGGSAVGGTITEDVLEYEGEEILGDPAKDVLSVDVDYDNIRGMAYVNDVTADNVIVITAGNLTSVYNSLTSSINNTYITTTLNDKALVKNSSASYKSSDLEIKLKKADGSDVALADADKTAGDYKLTIALKSGSAYVLASDAATEVLFRVERSKLTVNTPSTFNTVNSGDKVSDVKADVLSKFNTSNGPIKSTYATGDPTVVIAENGTALADDAQLIKSKDYVCTVTYTLKDEYKDQYEIVQAAPFKVIIGRLRQAIVKIDMVNDPITRPYTGSPVAAPVINGEGAEVKVTVTTPDEIVEGQQKNITPATITGKWYTVGEYDITNNPDSLGEELAEAPTEVGSYKYEIICYEDDSIYKEITNHKVIDVVVTATSLVLEPVSKGEFTVYKGQLVSEVVKNYKAKLTSNGTEVSYDEKFFGVTYNDPYVAQYYQPLFTLERGYRTGKTADGATPTEIINWQPYYGTSDGTIEKASGYDKPDNREYEYRIVFSGKKGIYTNGVLSNPIPVNTYTNTADKKYTIDLAESYKKSVTVDVKPSANAEFVIDDIVAGLGGKGVSVNAIYRKVYDHEPLFENRAAYKKATVKDASGNPVDVSKLTGKIEYTWYRFTPAQKTEGGKYVYDEAGKPVYDELAGTPLGTDIHNATEYAKLPKDAGNYFLKIHYDDTEHDGQYVIKDAYVFFEIEKQIIKVVPEGSLTAYTGSTVDSLIEKAKKDVTFKFYKVPGNDLKATATETIDLAAENEKYSQWYGGKGDSLYELDYYVEEDTDPDPNKEVFADCSLTDTFVENVTYRFGADLEFSILDPIGSNYEFDADSCKNLYYRNYTNVSKKVDDTISETCVSALPITIKKAGTKTLTFTVDDKMAVLEKTYDGTGIDIVAAVEKGFIKAKDGTTDVDVNSLGLTYKWDGYYVDNSYIQSGVSPEHAGTYDLTIRFDGNDTYAANNGVLYTGNFVIKRRELTITLPLKDEVEAGYYNVYGDKHGDYVGSYSGDVTKLYDFNKEGAITGFIPEDAEVFGNGVLSNAKAFFGEKYNGEKYRVILKNSFILDYDSATGQEVYLWNKGVDDRNNLMYSIINDNNDINDELLHNLDSYNYILKIKNSKIIANKHGRSEIDEAKLYSGSAHHVTNLAVENGDNYTTTITAMDGIPYYYKDSTNVDTRDNVIPSGNYLAFAVRVPYEYHNDYASAKKAAMYENAIYDAGGYVLKTGAKLYDNASNYGAVHYIPVIFPITKDTKEITFSIKWPAKDDFTETFVVKVKDVKKQLEANLMEAVAPKSLAFNAVSKKMVIGETQALDVKMTKLQSTDIVELNYDVASGKAVSVDKTSGVVTAVSKGSATVEVYPVKRNDKGEIEKIKMAKKVVVKITVADVTVPKVSSVFALDEFATIKYKVPSDGYRREIYVMEGNKTAANFESAIKAMEESDKKFDGIMGAGYYTSYDEVTDSFEGWSWTANNTYIVGEAKNKKNLTEVEVGGLDPNKKYTVYVRNVSAVRTLDDGKEVAVSAKGSIKQFTTTKVQANPVNMVVKQSEFDAGKAVFDKVKDDRMTFNLDAKKIQLDTIGTFNIKKAGIAPLADDNDTEDYLLPLTKDKDKLCAPKLTYFVLDADNAGPSEKKDKVHTKKIGDVYFAPSKIATINKKGELTLKGVGTIVIGAYDSVSKELHYAHYVNGFGNIKDSDDWLYCFDIKTEIGALQGKTVSKAKVGDTIDLYDYVVFKNKKNKKNVIAKPGLKAFTPIKVTSAENEAVTVYEDENGEVLVTINDPNKTTKLDVALRSNPEVKTTVTIKSKAMDAIKKLKAVDVVDDQADFTFTYQSQPYQPLDGVRVEVRDARNALMSSMVYNYDGFIDNAAAPYFWIYDDALFDGNGLWSIAKGTDEAKGTYVYRFRTSQNLVKQSNYKITVYPIFKEYLGKPASVKFKTTNVPYSHKSVAKVDPEGGEQIGIHDWTDGYGSANLAAVGYLTSGNTYNMYITPGNNFAYVNKTDKLSWSVKNTGIASVKVLSGTNEAVLTAKKPGRTQIEVKSGITKKVIARWYVRVKSVGDGKNSYGKNIPNDDQSRRFANIYAFDDTYNQGVEILTEANPVRFLTKIGSDDYRWVAFEAQYDATYRFYYEDASTAGYKNVNELEAKWTSFTTSGSDSRGTYKEADLKAGQKIYIKLTGSIGNRYAKLSVVASDINAKITPDTPVFTENADEITLIIPADGFYRITSSKVNDHVTVSSTTYNTYNEKNTTIADVIPLTKGSYTLKKSDYDYSDKVSLSIESIADTVLTTTETSIGNMKSTDVVGYKFKATATGGYKINLKGVADGSLAASIYKNSVYSTPASQTFGLGDSDYSITLTAGNEVWVILKATPSGTDKTVTGKISLTVPTT